MFRRLTADLNKSDPDAFSQQIALAADRSTYYHPCNEDAWNWFDYECQESKKRCGGLGTTAAVLTGTLIHVCEGASYYIRVNPGTTTTVPCGTGTQQPCIPWWMPSRLSIPNQAAMLMWSPSL
jgi:hypothetical protein